MAILTTIEPYGKWNSCKEKLPCRPLPDTVSVICLCWDGHDYEVCRFFFNAIRWARYDQQSGQIGFWPKYWMSIPQPPQE